MNSLLKRQLKKLLGPGDPIPSEWQRFVDGVGQAYDQFDDDRNMLERSLDLSSAELVEANSQLQAILETFPDLFFLTDGDGRILEQKNADKNAGYSSVENPVGTLIQDIHSAPADVLFQQAIAHVSERREPASIEYSLRIRATLEYYEARLLPLRGDKILLIIRNISVRRRAEEVIQKAQSELEEKVAERTAELRAANELLQREIGERKQIEKALKQANVLTAAVLDSMGDGVVVANPCGEFLLFNPAAEAIMGIGFTHGDPCLWTEKYGLYLPDQITPYPAIEVPLVKAMHGQSSDGVEMFVRNPQRPHGVWLSITARPLVDKTGAILGAVTVFSDVTARKRAEQEVRSLNAELEQRVIDRTLKLETANKELEAFGYSVSHDLRAPLRSIEGYSRLLHEDYAAKLDEEGRVSLEKIRGCARRMTQLIDDMMQLSKVTLTELRRGAVNLSALASLVCDDLRKGDPHRSVELIIEPNLIVQADEDLMRIVLENLLGNAWKFTGRQLESKIEFGRMTHDGVQACFVRDNGAGFDARFTHKLFQAFQRLHTTSEFPGTGIGLATVQRVIQRHGGRVWAEGQNGRGAAFFFTLPDEGGSS